MVLTWKEFHDWAGKSIKTRPVKDKMILKKIYLNVGSHHHCSTYRAKKTNEKSDSSHPWKTSSHSASKAWAKKKHEFAKKCNSPIFKMDLKLHLLHLKVFERVCSRKIKLSWKEFWNFHLQITNWIFNVDTTLDGILTYMDILVIRITKKQSNQS